jgi:poly(A) polymerase
VVFTDNPALDARRRDFTLNALFYDPVEDRILDFVEGQQDLKDGIIRAVGNPEERFSEDRLRLLRAIRFAARYQFQIEPATWAAIGSQANSLLEVSPERIRDELLKMLCQPNPGLAFRLMKASGLLAVILPELDQMSGVAQPPQFHPEGDVWEHTLLLLDGLDSPSQELALAALFHDIGKPPTFQVLDRIRFNNHDREGGQMFETVARRLRLPLRQTEAVQALIYQHMRIGRGARQMRIGKLKRMLVDPAFPELLELHRLDCLASHGDMSAWDFCQQKLLEFSPDELSPPPLVNGHDLIELGLRPGPLFGRILHRVRDLQYEGTLSTPAEARQYIQAHYREKDK